MGAWIETHLKYMTGHLEMSHPTWVRGLKHTRLFFMRSPRRVAPYVGAWIETRTHVAMAVRNKVAPYVGAWIETRTHVAMAVRNKGRTLRGCVD